MSPILLGVNVDHVATLRQARGTTYPDPVQAAFIAEQAGADGITVHLREDRRHIQDRDVALLKETLTVPLNLEMAVTEDMLQFAETIRPAQICLVPEKREELTTEGGLDVKSHLSKVRDACDRLSALGSEVSLFIDPDKDQIDAAKTCSAPAIEIHTGGYAEETDPSKQGVLLAEIAHCAEYAKQQGLIVNAGHGLHYHNTQAIAAIPELLALNIGHAIIARAVMVGLHQAIVDMKTLMTQSRG